MFATVIRLALLAGLVFGAVKFYPQYKPTIDPLLQNSKVLGTETLNPVIKNINEILPGNIKIPTFRRDSQESATSNSNPITDSPQIKSLVDSVKQKAGEMAQEQIDAAKKEAGQAFCQVLIEKIKTECGQ